MDACPLRPLPILLALSGGTGRVGFTFSKTDEMPVAIRGETPAWLPGNTLGLCYDESGNLWAIAKQADCLTISSCMAALS